MKDKLVITVHLPIDSGVLKQILEAFEFEEDAGHRVYLKQIEGSLGIYLEGDSE